MAAHITQQSNDKQELIPTLKNLAALPKELGTVAELLADSGYFREMSKGTLLSIYLLTLFQFMVFFAHATISKT